MHELSIASAIVEHVMAFAESSSPPRKILGVRVIIGELTCLDPEQLKFCYDVITRETPLEGSTLQVERADAEVFCPHCSYRGRPKLWEEALSDVMVATMQCPSCGAVVEATRGHDCILRTVRYAE